MEVLRNHFDNLYDSLKPLVFELTDKDPGYAHSLFNYSLKLLWFLNIDAFILDNPSNNIHNVSISNAAGFNKNATIPSRTLRYLGFDRVVIGTVTYDDWPGNPRPNIERYVSTKSMANWMGLPGIGAKRVAGNIDRYSNDNTPLTVNIMATPGKKGEKALMDIENTTLTLRSFSNVDRLELNISCPNTKDSSGGLDARKEYQEHTDEMLYVVQSNKNARQDTYVKVSPDSTEEDVEFLVHLGVKHKITGFTAGNTTTFHDPRFIPKSPGKGGASGDAVYEASSRVQQLFVEKCKQSSLEFRIIACGGINSPQRAKERISAGASELQIFTPLVFEGPKLLEKLRYSYQHN